MIAAWVRNRSSMERRTVAVAILPVLAALTWVLTIAPALSLLDSHKAWGDQATEQLSRYRHLAANAALYDEALGTLSEAPVQTRFYRHDDIQDPGAQLQSDLRTIYQEQGLRVRTTEVVPSELVGAVTRYGQTVTGTISEANFSELLQAIGTAEKHLRVEYLQVVAQQARADDAGPSLEIRLEVAGYALPQNLQTEASR
jgi:hypothetical protein